MIQLSSTWTQKANFLLHSQYFYKEDVPLLNKSFCIPTFSKNVQNFTFDFANTPITAPLTQFYLSYIGNL